MCMFRSKISLVFVVCLTAFASRAETAFVSAKLPLADGTKADFAISLIEAGEYEYYALRLTAKPSLKHQSSDNALDPYELVEREWPRLPAELAKKADRLTKLEACKEIVRAQVARMKGASPADKQKEFQKIVLQRARYFSCEKEAYVAVGLKISDDYTIINP